MDEQRKKVRLFEWKEERQCSLIGVSQHYGGLLTGLLSYNGMWWKGKIEIRRKKKEK